MCTTCNLNSTRLEPGPWYKFSATYCLAYRDAIKLREPVELLKGNFIRPEDVHFYEEVGIEDFRLDVGAFSTEDILAKVGFYTSRRFDGNLLHLVNMLSIGHRFQVANEGGGEKMPPLPDWTPLAIRAFFEWRARPGLAARVISIDNRELDGFLSRFVEQPCPPACGDCDHCDQFGLRAVRVDEELRDQFCTIMEEYRLAVVGGQFLPPGKGGR